MSSAPSNDQQNNNLLVGGQGFNSGTSSVSLFAAQPQKQQPDQQQQPFFGVPHQPQPQQQFYQQSAPSIGQSQQFYTQPHPGQLYTSQRSIQSQQFVQMPHQQPQQMFYHPQGGQQPQYGHQIGTGHSQQQFYAGHAQQIAASGIEAQEEEIIVEDEEEAPSMVVGETCTVETSSPSPDFANEQPPQLAQQSYYGQGQRIVMATMAQQQQSSTASSMGSAVVAQPMMSRAPAGAYYGQQVRPIAHPSQSQPRFIIMSTAYPRSPHQIGQQQRPDPNLLHTQHQTPAGHIIRRTTPFEEEEEEEEEDEEEEDEDEDEEEEEQQIGRQFQQTSSNNRLHTLKLPQIGQSLADTKIGPQMQPSVNVDEPRMTRAGRRKQIFEKSAKIGSGRKGSTEGSGTNPSDETMVKRTSNVTPPKRENIQQQTRPILDKGIVHIQAVQRLATHEGWRRMNDWLKGAIKTMDLAKLRQLMIQLTDADITIDLLRANDTPKLIKDLQKCADKDIANMATKMVTKWKQSVREGNNSEKQKQQQKATTKTGIIEKEQTTGAATKDVTTGKHLRRSSQSMDSDGGNGQSTSLNSPQKGGANAVQTRGRTSSITGASTSGNAQQQIGTRANSFGSASAGQAVATTTEKPKTAAKAKAKISRPRLTGLEGDDDHAKPPPSTKPAPLTKRLSGTAKSSTSPTTAISESPLTKIMAATAKFQAQQQPKRKPVDVMFSDDFMDSLSAADNVKPKKPKIVRRKLNPLPGTGNGAASTAVGSSGGKNDLIGGQLADASADPSALNSSGGGNENSGRRRVRFVDEIMGRELVSVRHFEIEEGERINVTKLDKEQIKHFDSQQEKMLLMNSGFGRRPCPGGPAVGVSGTFSSLTDPSLMPPGHGRRLFGVPMAQNSTAVGPGMQPPPPPMRSPFVVMSDKKVIGTSKTEKYPWKLIPVTHKPLIEPGNKSESKEIELERQKTTMSSLILPIPLPISDLDEQELKRHREESLSHMPKIIPLELIAEVVEQKGAGMTIQQAKIETKQKEEEGLGGEEPMEIVEEEDKKMGIKAKVEKMEEDIRLPISPARPQVSRMSSSDESEEDKMDVEMDDGPKKEQEGREDLIASPEPEHLDASMDDSTDSIKEIPIEKIRSSTEEDEEEDLDIRDIPQQQQIGCRLETPKGSTPISAVTSSASIQEILKKNSHLIPMLKNLKNTTLGSEGTPSKGRQDGAQKQEEGKILDQSTSAATITSSSTSTPVQFIGGTIPTTLPNSAIPPPPTHLYPHRPPIAGLTPHQFGGPPPHIQQIMNMTRSPANPIPFPPPNFSSPPPRIGRPFPSPPVSNAAFGQFPMGQELLPQNLLTNVPPPQQSPQKVSTIPPIGLMQMPHLASREQPQKMPPSSQDEASKTEDSTTSSSAAQPPSKGSPTSPGPPGLDEGGSPPPAPEGQSQQLTVPSSTQGQEGQSPMVVGQPQQQQQQISPQQSSVAAGTSLTPPQQQPVMSLQEARNVAGICNYFMRHNKCDYGDKCKFAHDESTITLGVQMAMRGVNIGGGRGGMRGGLRGRGGFVGGPGRGGNAFRMGADGGNGSAGQSGGFDDRRRRGGGFGSGGGGRDYDLSPIRDGGGNVGKGGVSGYRDRRFRQQQSPRQKYSSSSRSHDRYSRRRQSRSRSRSRERSDRDRSNRDRRRSRSASKSSSSSIGTYSRSPTPIRRRREGRQSGASKRPRSSEKHSNNRRMERKDREERKSSPPAHQRRSSANSSSSTTSSMSPERDEKRKQKMEKMEEKDSRGHEGGGNNESREQQRKEETQQKVQMPAENSDEVQIIE